MVSKDIVTFSGYRRQHSSPHYVLSCIYISITKIKTSLFEWIEQILRASLNDQAYGNTRRY